LIHIACLVAAVLAAPLSGAPPQEPEAQLLNNAELADDARGWLLKGADVRAGAGPEGGVGVVLSAVEGRAKWSHLGIRVEDLPTLRELHFSVQAQGPTGMEVVLNVGAYDAGGATVEEWHDKFPLEPADWRALERTYVLPEKTAKLAIWIIGSNEQDIVVARPSLTAGRPGVAKNLSGPGILYASASSAVRASQGETIGRVLFPIPLLTDHQVPLTFDVKTDPPSALRGFRWIHRDDERNWLCEVSVAPEGEGTLVSWESLVLVRDREDAPLPAATAPDVPEGAAPWLRATACVQSDDEGIAAKAAELQRGTESISGFVENVLEFTSTHTGDGEPFHVLDARTSLKSGGSCTSRANLAAALLRAGGLPARTSAHLPTWSGPLYEHWHVEYWHPGAGWTWIEPTLGQLLPRTSSLVVLNIAGTDDEDASFDEAILRSGVALGAPRFAVHEHSKELRVATQKWRKENDRLNEAYPVATLEVGDVEDLFASAREAWKGLAARCKAGEHDPDRSKRITEACREKDVAAKLVMALESTQAATDGESWASD